MKKLTLPAIVFFSALSFTACEGGPYDSSGNGAVIRETNKDDMEQLDGHDGDKVTMPNTGSDKPDHNENTGHTATPADSTHESGHDHH